MLENIFFNRRTNIIRIFFIRLEQYEQKSETFFSGFRIEKGKILLEFTPLDFDMNSHPITIIPLIDFVALSEKGRI